MASGRAERVATREVLAPRSEATPFREDLISPISARVGLKLVFQPDMEIHLGCSGWFYWHWKGVFYPETIPTKEWFGHYTKAFDTVELNAPFFTDRFASMRWSILTPDRCMHWDGSTVHFTSGLTRAEAPDEDAVEALWRGYYANIFNPARVKTHAMQKEKPARS